MKSSFLQAKKLRVMMASVEFLETIHDMSEPLFEFVRTSTHSMELQAAIGLFQCPVLGFLLKHLYCLYAGTIGL